MRCPFSSRRSSLGDCHPHGRRVLPNALMPVNVLDDPTPIEELL
ncbi:MAG: hypothetical protein U0793_06165 [Gemmataceae bacterium]